MAKGPRIFTESSEQLTSNAFLDLEPQMRHDIYAGLMLAIVVDLNSVSDQDLQLLSYGYHRDEDVWEYMGGQDQMEYAMVPVWDTVKESGDQGAMWEMMQGDRIEDESLQVPLMAAAIVGAFYGGAGALGATGVIGGGSTGVAGAGAGIGSAQAGLGTAMTPAIWLASQITGVIPSSVIYTTAKVGSSIVLGTGTVGLTASIWDNVANLDENEIARMDAINEADEKRAAMREADRAKQTADVQEEAADALQTTTDYWAAEAEYRAKLESGEASFFGNTQTFDRAAGQGQTGDPSLPAGQIGEGLENPPSITGGVGPVPDNRLGDLFAGANDLIDSRALRYNMGIEGADDIAKAFPVGPMPEKRGAETRLTGRMVPGDYKDSDFERLVAELPEWKVDWLQRQLVDAGRMSEGQMTGLMDRSTVAQIQVLLTESNDNNTSWTSWTQRIALEGLRLQKLEDEKQKEARLKALGPFVRRTYLEPDLATLREASENAIEQRLGRKINDWEMQLLVADQQDDYEEKHGVQVGLDRQAHDLQVRAIEEDLDYTDEIGGGTVENIDVAARFQQRFDKQFGKELQRRENVADTSRNVGNLMTGISRGMRTMGG